MAAGLLSPPSGCPSTTSALGRSSTVSAAAAGRGRSWPELIVRQRAPRARDPSRTNTGERKYDRRKAAFRYIGMRRHRAPPPDRPHPPPTPPPPPPPRPP